MRVVEYSEDIDVHPHDAIWLVFREHKHHVRATFLAGEGVRFTRIYIGADEQSLRDRILVPRVLSVLRRRFPSSTVVTVGVESPIPSPLRSALRREWGVHYAGGRDEPSPVP
jgi:hypothetical protein